MTPEKRFEMRVRDWLKAHGCWFFKVFGNAYQRSGIPDIVGCAHGMLFAIEVKAEHGRPSALQVHEIEEIRKAGGYARVLYPQEFDAFKEEFETFMASNAMVDMLLQMYWSAKKAADEASALADRIKGQIEAELDGSNYRSQYGKATWVPVKESVTVDWKKFEKTEPDEAKGIMEDYPKKTKTGGYYKYTEVKPAEEEANECDNT